MVDEGDGVQACKLESWRDFGSFLVEEMDSARGYIWRGERCTKSAYWKPLEPSLHRVLRRSGRSVRHTDWLPHFERFKKAIRGRSAEKPRDEQMDVEDLIWALGRHHGLHTPLLDWTGSPFAAAFFAFWETGDKQTNCRAVYALSKGEVQSHQEDSNRQGPRTTWKDLIFIDPGSYDNPRLVAQAGSFTQLHELDMTIEDVVRGHFKGTKKAVLVKITIPDEGRREFLRHLNLMNINPLSLFPDLYGSSKYCNMKLEMEDY